MWGPDADLYTPRWWEWPLIGIWPPYAKRWGERCHERARQWAIQAYRREREIQWQIMTDEIHQWMPDFEVRPLVWDD